MKVVVACYGTRGDVEPCAAAGRELRHRGHEVLMAVPADLFGFIESAGLAAAAYGPDLQAMLDAHRKYYAFFFRNCWRVQEVARLSRAAWGLPRAADYPSSRRIPELGSLEIQAYDEVCFPGLAAE